MSPDMPQHQIAKLTILLTSYVAVHDVTVHMPTSVSNLESHVARPARVSCSSSRLSTVIQASKEVVRVDKRPRNVNPDVADQVSDLGGSQIVRFLLDDSGDV